MKKLNNTYEKQVKNKTDSMSQRKQQCHIYRRNKENYMPLTAWETKEVTFTRGGKKRTKKPVEHY